MSQQTVERVIGRLVTDEGFRRRFALDAATAVAEITACGCDLNPWELRALLRIDTRRAERFADAIDPRLQKADLSGGLS